MQRFISKIEMEGKFGAKVDGSILVGSLARSQPIARHIREGKSESGLLTGG